MVPAPASPARSPRPPACSCPPTPTNPVNEAPAMHTAKLQDPRSGRTVRVARLRHVYRVETEEGEYVGFLDWRVSAATGRPEYRAAGYSGLWHPTLREAVADLIQEAAQ